MNATSVINTIDTSLQIAENTAKGFKLACIAALAAGIYSRRVYSLHVHQGALTALRVIAAITILLLMVGTVLVEAGWKWIRQFTIKQYANGDFHEYLRISENTPLRQTARKSGLPTDQPIYGEIQRSGFNSHTAIPQGALRSSG